MKALVTGAAGFAGRHLTACLLAQGHEVVAADLTPPTDELPAGGRAVALDVTDPQACWEVLHEARADAVFHLAGFSHVGRAESEPEACLAVNAEGTRHMLAACLDGHANARFLLVSSGEVYGRVLPEDLPVNEDHPLRPGTIYGASKACAEMHVHHAVARGLHAVVCRAFNHIGPGQSDQFVSAAFAHQVADIEVGGQEPVLRVGNLDAVRDFTDVADTVVGYVAALEHGHPGETFNVTSGVAVPIQQLLDTLLSLSSVDVVVEQDPSRMRPLDVPIFTGDGTRLAERAGYRPGLDLPLTVGRVLDDWRRRVAAGA